MLALLTVLITLIAALSVAFYQQDKPNSSQVASNVKVVEVVEVKVPETFCEGKPVENYLINLSYSEKLKLLLVPTATPSQLQRSYKILNGFGGYVLVDTLNHYQNSEQLVSDTAKLKTLGQIQDIPPLIGLDAEGGIIQRISWYEMKSISELKELAKPERCKIYAEQSSKLKELGFNWSLAPVVDVPTQLSHWIASRTIDTSPQIVGELSTEYVQCIQDNNVLATAKHFPGHGGTSLDSHLQVPTVGKSYKEWLNTDALPFIKLSNEGVASIMVGHLRFDSIDETPSSKSTKWMTEIIRDEIEFEGIVVTDDLGMLGPESSGDCARDIYDALIAGADLAMFPSGGACVASEVVTSLQKMQINESLIDSKLNRIITTKREFLCD